MAAAKEAAPAGGAGTAGEAKPAKITYAHQDDLPSLPVPDLDSTLDKLLENVKTFRPDPTEWEHTRACIEDFRAGKGPELQKLLEGRAEAMRNWLEEWWETYAYLQPRYPAAVNINWHGVLPGTWGEAVDQVEGAAMFIDHILRFRRELVVDQTLEPEELAGQKLCMYQYSRMFNSCKVPVSEEMDELRVYPEAEGTADHIVVMRNNFIFKMRVLDEAGDTLPMDDLIYELDAVKEGSRRLFEMKRATPISVLTSENRTNWAKARQHLVELDPKNEASLEVIQRALFVVVLETSSPEELEECALEALVGDGRNKWFDKPFQMIVFENGRGGVNGEHAWADAMVVVKLFYHVMRTLEAQMAETGPHKRPAPPGKVKPGPKAQAPERLDWVLDRTVRAAVELASANIHRMAKDVDLTTLVFRHYGKEFMKVYRLMPDFYVQMSIQLAYWRLHKKVVATYESAHTRAFYHGRTETIRTTCKEVLAFVKAMDSKEATEGEKFDALKTAVEHHLLTVKDSLMGQGIDRHLMGLYIASEMMGYDPKPSIFTDKGFIDAKTYVLSTSNISLGDSNMFGGFMPITTDGYGVCYGLEADIIKFSITSWQQCKETSAAAFKTSLTEALLDMQALCLTRNVLYVAKAKL